MNLGEVPARWASLQAHDINPYELLSWVPLVVLTVVMGIYPKLVFGITNGAVESLARLFASG
ncbi:MAG: hypothetical protein C4317_03405 [Acidimicrobiia bacterium]